MSASWPPRRSGCRDRGDRAGRRRAVTVTQTAAGEIRRSRSTRRWSTRRRGHAAGLVVRRARDASRAAKGNCRSRRWARSRVGSVRWPRLGLPGLAAELACLSTARDVGPGVRRSCPGFDRRARHAARDRSEERARIEFPPAGGRSGDVTGCRGAAADQAGRAVLRGLRNVSEKTRCRYCSTPAATATLVCVSRSRRTCSRWSDPTSSEAATTCSGGALDPWPAWAPTS